MLLTNVIQEMFFKLFALIMSLVYSISGPVVPPSTENPIDVTKPNEVNLVFAALADPQVSNYMFDRYVVFEETMMDLHASKYDLDALILAGDIAENGLAEEYQLVYDGISGLEGCRYISATGNHDIRLRAFSQSMSRFYGFANALNNNENPIDTPYHSEEVNGYKFIVMGSERTEFEEAYISDEQIKWLDSEIAAENGDPVFVICHQPLKLTHDLPNTWGSGTNVNAGSVGDSSDAIKEVITKYENVIFITGHLHSGFGEQSYEQLGSAHLVNLPSLTIENKDGEYNTSGLGYIVEVYDDEVIFRARNLQTGEWVPDYDEIIELV